MIYFVRKCSLKKAALFLAIILNIILALNSKFTVGYIKCALSVVGVFPAIPIHTVLVSAHNYSVYGSQPILPFYRGFACGSSECVWKADSTCCLAGKSPKAHLRPLPWLNAAPSLRKSAGKSKRF